MYWIDSMKFCFRRLNFELKETEAAKLKEIDEIKEQKTILEGEPTFRSIVAFYEKEN